MLYLLFGSINLPMMIGMLASCAIDLYRHTTTCTHSELYCTISMHNIWTYSGCGCILTVYIYMYGMAALNRGTCMDGTVLIMCCYPLDQNVLLHLTPNIYTQGQCLDQ